MIPTGKDADDSKLTSMKQSEKQQMPGYMERVQEKPEDAVGLLRRAQALRGAVRLCQGDAWQGIH